MMVPGVQFVGAILLLGIACKLVQDEEETGADGGPTPTSLRQAILRIAVADLVMSLDNVVAIAGVSGSNPALLTVGLVLSTATILAFSQVIVVMMNRFPWIVYAGTGILALTAAGMIVHELDAVRQVAWASSPTLHFPLWADWGLRGAAVGICVTAGRWWPRRFEVAAAS